MKLADQLNWIAQILCIRPETMAVVYRAGRSEGALRTVAPRGRHCQPLNPDEVLSLLTFAAKAHCAGKMVNVNSNFRYRRGSVECCDFDGIRVGCGRGLNTFVEIKGITIKAIMAAVLEKECA